MRARWKSWKSILASCVKRACRCSSVQEDKPARMCSCPNATSCFLNKEVAATAIVSSVLVSSILVARKS
jgi:hypothetical protein